jgi:hypothetical protein
MRVLALSAQSELWYVQGKAKAALAPAREAYEIVRRRLNDDAGLVLTTTAALAPTLVAVDGPTPEVVALHRDAVHLARAVKPVDEARLVNVLSRACAALIEVQPADARELCQEAIDKSANLPMQGGIHTAYASLGQLAADRGDWSAAVTYRRRALEVVTATASHSNLVPLISSLLAWAEWVSGIDKPGAVRRADESARTAFGTMPNSAWSYAPYLIQSLVLAQTGDGAGAELWIRRAMSVTAFDIDRDPRAAVQHMALAHASLLQGKREEALMQINRGLALAETTKVPRPVHQGLVAIRRALDGPAPVRVEGGAQQARAPDSSRPNY